MSDLNSFDFVYRYNCVDDISLNSDILKYKDELFSKLLILPFAGYTYVSDMLADAYSLLNVSSSSLFIFIPTQSVCCKNLMTFNRDFLCSLNELIKIDFEKLDNLSSMYSIIEGDFEFEYKEILRIHLDFLRALFSDIKIIPLFYNTLDNGIVKNILETFWSNTSFVFLSNMSCGFNYNDAKKNDKFIAYSIENLVERNYSFEDFTAYSVLNELLNFVSIKGYSFIRLGVLNSGDVGSNLMITRGFGAWFLYQGICSKLVKRYFRQDIKDFILFNLSKVLNCSCSTCFRFPKLFDQEFKIFVSFEKNGFVRGVSGSYKTPEVLYKALVKRSFGAAFSDNRFSPLRLDELKDIKIFITFVAENIMDSVSFEL